MSKTMKYVIGGLVALFALSGILKLISFAFSISIGLFATLVNIAWSVLFNPLVLVAIIIFLAVKLNKKR